MTAHITAEKGEIAKIVLMPGDPLRAKHIADNMLQDVKLVNTTRNAFYFTGTYKGVPVTIGASGMGCPSIGIYSYELYTSYEVECIIRIGTAGAYDPVTKVYDVVNTDMAFSESTYAREAFGYDGEGQNHQGIAYDLINETAAKMNIPVKAANVHSSDVFYRSKKGTPRVAQENNCICVEMEAFALFMTATRLGAAALSITAISDSLVTGAKLSTAERQNSFADIMQIVLPLI